MMSSAVSISTSAHDRVQSELQVATVPLEVPAVYLSIELVFDLLSFGLAWYATFAGRILLNKFMERQLSWDRLATLTLPLTLVMALWVLVSLWMHGVRIPKELMVQMRLMTAVRRSFETALTVTSLIIVVTFFWTALGVELSRSFVLLLVPLTMSVVLATSYLRHRTIINVLYRWPGIRRVAIVGPPMAAMSLLAKVQQAQGVHVVGIVAPEHEDADQYPELLTVLGKTQQLAEIINKAQLHRIIMANAGIPEDEVDRCGYISKRMGVTVSHIVGRASGGAEVQFSTQYGMQLINVRPVAFTRAQERIKRTCDIIGAAMALTAFAPISLVCAMLIRLTSAGPIIYRSARVGRGGRHFMFLKFRSMYTQSQQRAKVASLNEKSGHIFKIRNDPRITPVGRFMRRYSIDELPQLINVLKGDMSLLGPRPLPAEDLDADGMSRKFSEWAEQRSRVLPGITGLWQVRGRSELAFTEMMKLDIDYIRDWSLLLDLKILLQTPLVVLTGRGAY
jgi:exopolysaccharide biosynthesis polyprenyl glycosylphosphotransferase